MATVTMIANKRLLKPAVVPGQRFDVPDKEVARVHVLLGNAEYAPVAATHAPGEPGFPKSVEPPIDLRPKLRGMFGLAYDASDDEILAAVKVTLGKPKWDTEPIHQNTPTGPTDVATFRAKVAEKVKADTRDIGYGQKLAEAQQAVSIEEPALYVASSAIKPAEADADRMSHRMVMREDIRQRVAAGATWDEAVRAFSAEHPDLALLAIGYTERSR